jgi:hypothetical protein
MLPVLAAGIGVVGLGMLLYFRSLNPEQSPPPDALPAFPSLPLQPDSGGAATERAAKNLLISHSQGRRLPPTPLPEPSPLAPVSGTAGSLPRIDPNAAPRSKKNPEGTGARLEARRTRFNPDKGQAAYFLLVLPAEAYVEARFMDSRGRTLRMLKDTLSGPARIPITWNGTDARDEDADAGTYYLRVITPWFSQTEKIELERGE